MGKHGPRRKPAARLDLNYMRLIISSPKDTVCYTINHKDRDVLEERTEFYLRDQAIPTLPYD